MFLFVSSVTTLAAKDYSKLLDDVVEGTPKKKVDAAFRAIQFAGPAAFPTLLAHLEDSRLCKSGNFEQARSDSNPDGSVLLNSNGTAHHHRTTVGEACFFLIQQQIEGNWFGVCQQFYVLSPDNVKEWLNAHKHQSRKEMFASARAESIRRAEAALASNPNDELLKRCVEFLRSNRRFTE